MKRTALCILLAAVLLLSACAAKTPAAPAAGSALTATVAPFEKDEINDTPVQKADGEQPAETPSGGTISQSIPAELPEIGVAIPEFDAPEIQAVDVTSGTYAEDLNDVLTLGNWLRNYCDSLTEAWTRDVSYEEPWTAEDYIRSPLSNSCNEDGRNTYMVMFDNNYEDLAPEHK